MLLPNYNCSVCNKDKHEGWCEVQDYGNGLIGVAYEKDVITYNSKTDSWINRKGE